jgi:5'(3')-deoxyribonucleotidase
MMKQKVFVDMDGVLANFGKKVNEIMSDPTIPIYFKKHPDEIDGVFRDLEPLQEAFESVVKLHKSNKYDLFIATTAPWKNPSSFSDKRIWIKKHFGDIFEKKMFITHRKDLLLGDYLIDDRLANGAKDFKGQLIHFGWNYESKTWNDYKDWKSVLKELL